MPRVRHGYVNPEPDDGDPNVTGPNEWNADHVVEGMPMPLDGQDGDDGWPGPPGQPGQTGAAGSAGALGPTGQTGIQGPPGNDGEDGQDGIPGPPGATGPAGATGSTGAPGSQGIIGRDGEDGDDGWPGPPGQTGATGPIGATGSPGQDGEDGLDGPPGPIGIPGPQGIQGIIGRNGEDGDDGWPGPPGISGAVGSIGPQGVPGNDGEDGLDGMPGPTGPTGYPGPAGPRGITGEDGEDTWPVLPSFSSAPLSKTDDTNVTLTLGGSPLSALLQPTSLTLGWTGVLSQARGGTGSATPFANPSASIGLAAVNGSATTFMRSDAAPALSQAIAPTWTGLHIWSATLGSTGGDASPGIALKTSGTATAVQPEYSPQLRFSASGWKTNATAGAQTVDVRQRVVAVNGAAAPLASMVWSFQVNGGGYADRMTLDSNGDLSIVLGGLQIGGAAPSGNYLRGNATRGVYSPILTADLPAVIDIATGFRIGGVAANRAYLIGDGTNFVSGTPAYPDIVNSNTDRGTWTPAYVGFSINPTTLYATWQKVGGKVIVNYAMNALGTSNSSTFQITGLPFAIATGTIVFASGFGAANGGANITTLGRADVSTGTISFATDTNGTGWVASGVKGVYALTLIFDYA